MHLIIYFNLVNKYFNNIYYELKTLKTILRLISLLYYFLQMSLVRYSECWNNDLNKVFQLLAKSKTNMLLDILALITDYLKEIVIKFTGSPLIWRIQMSDVHVVSSSPLIMTKLTESKTCEIELDLRNTDCIDLIVQIYTLLNGFIPQRPILPLRHIKFKKNILKADRPLVQKVMALYRQKELECGPKRPSLLNELVYALHYLQDKNLLHIFCDYIATKLKDQPLSNLARILGVTEQELAESR